MKYQYMNATLNYEIVGEGKPVIILHGFGHNLDMMKACMEPVFLTESSYKRIYVDLPGMGKSECTDDYATADDVLEILLRFIESVVHEKFLIIGQSYGGYLARGILSKFMHRIDGLMLLCPVVVPINTKRNVPVQYIRFEDSEFLNSLNEKDREDFLRYAVLANEEIYKRYKNEVFAELDGENGTFMKKLKENYEFSFDVDQEIEKYPFERPTLFICGRQDTCVGYKDLWKLIEDYPRAALSVVDVAGHNLQIEQPSLFNELVRNWLLRVEKYL